MKRLKSLAKYLVAFSFLMFLVIMGMSYVIPRHETLALAREGLEDVGWALMCARLTIIGLCWLYWVPFFEWYYKAQSPKTLAYIKSRRNTFAVLFLAIELVLVQNLFGTAWGWIN